MHTLGSVPEDNTTKSDLAQSDQSDPVSPASNAWYLFPPLYILLHLLSLLSLSLSLSLSLTISLTHTHTHNLKPTSVMLLRINLCCWRNYKKKGPGQKLRFSQYFSISFLSVWNYTTQSKDTKTELSRPHFGPIAAVILGLNYVGNFLMLFLCQSGLSVFVQVKGRTGFFSLNRCVGKCKADIAFRF